jgi:putative transposase
VSLGKVGLRHLNFTENNTMTTKTNIALAELAEKGADADLLKQMIQFVAG